VIIAVNSSAKNTISAPYSAAMHLSSGSSTAGPLAPSVAAIAAPTPNGANRITMSISLNITSAPASARSLTGLALAPAAATASPNSTLNTTIGRMSLCAMASTGDNGNASRMKSHAVLTFASWPIEVASSGSCAPTPGWTRLATAMPRNSATVVASSNQMIALSPRRPTILPPAPATPATSVVTSSSAMIILISRRNS
jgi:hypothetical protein